MSPWLWPGLQPLEVFTAHIPGPLPYMVWDISSGPWVGRRKESVWLFQWLSTYSWPWNHLGLHCTGLLISRFFSINTVNVFSFPYDFLNNFSVPLAYSMVRIQQITHVTYNCKICVSQMLMFSPRLSINSRLLVKFWGVKIYTRIFNCAMGQCPNPHIVQESTVYLHVIVSCG